MKQYVGRELGVSDWTSVTQHDINLFAGVTGDWQWIHTDPDRAADGPFGTTIAHGYYTLSLAPALLAQVLALDEFEFAVKVVAAGLARHPRRVTRRVGGLGNEFGRIAIGRSALAPAKGDRRSAIVAGRRVGWATLGAANVGLGVFARWAVVGATRPPPAITRRFRAT